ncbi:hypothetical protein WJX77_006991 [Trebouxia sp. C0004]
MTVYACRCGFESGTAVGFQRHIARYKGETGKHRMVSKSDAAAKPLSKPADAVHAQKTVEASQPSERSWLSGLWASDATIQGKPTTEEGSYTATDGSDRPSKAIKDVKKSTQDADMLEPSSSGGESAWEKVSSFADSGEEGPPPKDEYAALTAQLAASGPAAGTRAKTKRPASVSRRSERKTAETSTLISADPASPIPAAALTAPSETPSRASSQTLSHTTAIAPDDMQRAASHGSASPSTLDVVHMQSPTSGGQADGSPAVDATTSLDTQQAAEPSTSGNPSASSPQRAETSARSPSPPVRSVSPLKKDELHQRGRQIMRKSIGVVNWLTASTDAALTMHPASAQSIQALEQRNACSADDVEAVLLWQEPMQTTKLFLGGMYILICLRQLVLGVELLQPSTAIAGLLLALLLGSTVRVALMPASQRQPPRRELALQAQITQAVSRSGAQVASVLGAIAVVMYRRLSGHDRTGTTVWLALTLWTTMALGEAALLSQSSMSLAVWCAIFGLPSLYLQCRHILDVLVEEALQLVAAFLRAGQRGTVMFAAAAGLVVLMAVPLSIFARLCCGCPALTQPAHVHLRFGANFRRLHPELSLEVRVNKRLHNPRLAQSEQAIPAAVKLQGTEELLCYLKDATLAGQVFKTCKLRANCQEGTLQAASGMDIVGDELSLQLNPSCWGESFIHGGTLADAAQLANQWPPGLAAELITLHLSADHRSFGHGPGHHAAIVMPQYVVGLLHSFKRARLQLKLEAKGCYVRLSTCTQNLVHMDVKGENTFVDMTGTGGFVIWALL